MLNASFPKPLSLNKKTFSLLCGFRVARREIASRLRLIHFSRRILWLKYCHSSEPAETHNWSDNTQFWLTITYLCLIFLDKFWWNRIFPRWAYNVWIQFTFFKNSESVNLRLTSGDFVSRARSDPAHCRIFFRRPCIGSFAPLVSREPAADAPEGDDSTWKLKNNESICRSALRCAQIFDGLSARSMTWMSSHMKESRNQMVGLLKIHFFLYC